MAVTISTAAGVSNPNAGVYAPTSVKGAWVTAHGDAKTAQSAAELIAPFSITSTNVRWIKVPDGAMRVLFRCSYASTGTTVSVSPVIRVMGTHTDLAGTAPANNGTISLMRLDNVSPSAAGLTLTCTAAATDLNDGSVRKGQPHSLTLADCIGAQYVAVLVETAFALSAGSGAAIVEAMFLN